MKAHSYDKLLYINKKFSLPNFKYLVQNLPVFCVHSSQIKILHGPHDFYNELLTQSSTATRRIAIASLYLGTGTLEKKLVLRMSERLARQPDLRIHWLLDFTRASRGETNSRTTLLPLIKEYESNCSVSLFHTPRLRGVYKWLIPQRWNEVIGLQHMKIYVYDDSVLISGANLSNDYFVNRQDRCYVINNCRELADFYELLIKEVSLRSLQLRADNTTDMDGQIAIHPFKGNYNLYCQHFENTLRHFWSTEIRKNAQRLETLYNRFQTQADQQAVPNTLLFPTLQMPNFGIKLDSDVTLNFLESVPENSRVHLATGYFNLTEQYVNTILKSHNAMYDILCAHPKANGFFGAKGFAGGVPDAYTNLCKKFYRKIQEWSLEDRIRIFEFWKEGWTFHSKGLWYFPPKEATPSMTLVGSPNFGFRSVYRDLETQLFVSTICPFLRQEMQKEERNLFQYSDIITKTTFESPDRRVPLWVRMVTYFMKYFF